MPPAGKGVRSPGLGGGLGLALLLVVPAWYGAGRADFGRPEFELAEVLARQGDREGALRAYERAVARHPQDPDVRFRYGEQLERCGRAEEALDEYRRAATLAPWSYKPPLALGAALLVRDDLPGAWEAFAEAERRGDPHGRALYDMGLVRERQGQFAAALDLHRRSLSLPDHPREALQRRLGIARSLLALGRAEEAEAEFAAARREAIDPAAVTLEHAAAWLRAGDAARTLEILDAGASKRASGRDLQLRARALRLLGRDEEARRAAEQARALDPKANQAKAWEEAPRPPAARELPEPVQTESP